MTVTTPKGIVLPMGTQGLITVPRPADMLPISGGITFSPSDPVYFGYDWGGDGYFYFTPNLAKGDAPTKITISYWTELEPVKLPPG